MKSKIRLKNKYLAIRGQCAITTAASNEFAPYVINLLSSIKSNFSEHPEIYVFDLGLSYFYRKEISSFLNVKLIQVPSFVPFWKSCWTWKTFVWNYPTERFIFHIDSGAVVLRGLELLYLAIQKHGYLVFSQGQILKDITPQNFFHEFGVHFENNKNRDVFAAGVIGFDINSNFGKAIVESKRLASLGWCLGWSNSELYRVNSDFERLERDCALFRHDQTLINILAIKYLGHPLIIRSERKYLGVKSKNSHPRQFIWHSRRKKESMIYWDTHYGNDLIAYLVNRFIFRLKTLKNRILN